MTLMNWDIFPLPMNEKFVASLKPKYPEGFHEGVFFEGGFELSAAGDTYFDMSNYSKGMVYVNGHHLGRYWKMGPQQRLYCPAGWLKKGKNRIVVFDLHQQEAAMVSGFATAE
jgi:beta-galactosidase